MTIYFELEKINAEMNNFGQDLHVKQSPEVLKLINALGVKFERTINPDDNSVWMLIPFGYDPHIDATDDSFIRELQDTYAKESHA